MIIKDYLSTAVPYMNTQVGGAKNCASSFAISSVFSAAVYKSLRVFAAPNMGSVFRNFLAQSKQLF